MRVFACHGEGTEWTEFTKGVTKVTCWLEGSFRRKQGRRLRAISGRRLLVRDNREPDDASAEEAPELGQGVSNRVWIWVRAGGGSTTGKLETITVIPTSMDGSSEALFQ